MEGNRKGPGVFYAVVGVATLLVAIIGATFAYFTAFAQEDSTVTGTTATAISLVVNKVAPSEAAYIVPLESGEANVANSEMGTTNQIPTAIANSCIDDNDNEVCQIYSATVTNTSATETVLVTTQLRLSVPTGLENMRWQLLSGTSTSDFATTGTAVSSHTTPSLLHSSEYLTAGNSATYYFIVWLEETGAVQNTEMSKTFTGSVTANVVNSSGVAVSQTTATFS